MNYNSDFKHDLELGQMAERILGSAIKGNTIEVKYDRAAKRTGNVFIEYSSRGKNSGILTTKADWYMIFVDKEMGYFVSTKRLKTIIINNSGKFRKARGGDNNTSKGWLIPVFMLSPV